LAQASHALQQASSIEKPVLFFKYLNWDIASSTFSHFQPGVPFTMEGLLYGFFGIIMGYGIFYGFKRVCALAYGNIVSLKPVAVDKKLYSLPHERKSDEMSD